MELLSVVYPQIGGGLIIQAMAMGAVLYTVVSVLGFVAIRNKILSIWEKRKRRH